VPDFIPQGRILAFLKCPVCDGQGLVSRPEWVAGDQLTWTSSEAGPYPCRRCDGIGTIEVREDV
jgi:RecJ-like exonuclease